MSPPACFPRPMGSHKRILIKASILVLWLIDGTLPEGVPPPGSSIHRHYTCMEGRCRCHPPPTPIRTFTLTLHRPGRRESATRGAKRKRICGNDESSWQPSQPAPDRFRRWGRRNVKRCSRVEKGRGPEEVEERPSKQSQTGLIIPVMKTGGLERLGAGVSGCGLIFNVDVSSGSTHSCSPLLPTCTRIHPLQHRDPPDNS